MIEKIIQDQINYKNLRKEESNNLNLLIDKNKSLEKEISEVEFKNKLLSEQIKKYKENYYIKLFDLEKKIDKIKEELKLLEEKVKAILDYEVKLKERLIASFNIFSSSSALPAYSS